jgi:phosphoenolpyruvate carboxylase
LSELVQVPPERDAPLRADVSYLGRLLGQVLVEQGGVTLTVSGIAAGLRNTG